MPGRNLVTVALSCGMKQWALLILATLVCFSMGCSQLKPSGLREMMADPSLSDKWEQDSASELEKKFLRSPDSFEPTSIESAVAMQGKDGNTNFQSKPSAANSESPNSLRNGATQSSSACDCGHPDCRHKGPTLKLAKMEPIEFPGAANPVAVNPVSVTQEISSRNRSRPLVPLLFDSETRAVRANSPGDLRSTTNQLTNDVLVPNTQTVTDREAKKLSEIPLVANPVRTIGTVDIPLRRAISNEKAQKISQPVTEDLAETRSPAPQVQPDLTAATQKTRIVLPSVGTDSPADPVAKKTAESTQSKRESPANLIKAEMAGIKVDKSEFEIPQRKAAVAASATSSAAAKLVKTAFAPPIEPAKQDSNDFQPSSSVKTASFQSTPNAVDKNPVKPPTNQISNEKSVIASVTGTIPVKQKNIEDMSDAELDRRLGLSPRPSTVIPKPSNDFVKIVPAVAKTTAAAGKPASEFKPSTPLSKSDPFATQLPTELKGQDFKPFVAPATFIENPSTVPKPVAVVAPPAVAKPKPAPKLQLSHGEFCTSIRGFGQITPVTSTDFGPNQRTLVYCEVANYRSVQQTTSAGSRFVTRLRGSYSIVNRNGQKVQAGEFPEVEDVTVRQRHDFYLYFPVTLNGLQPGKYRLQLSIDDLAAQTSAALDAPIEFSVE